MTMMLASSAAFDLIKEFESCVLSAYPDPITNGEPWTIGWGTTVYPDGRRVQKGDTCTQEEADLWLSLHVTECEEQLNGAIEVLVAQQMFDALVSLLYNVGPGIVGKRDGLIHLKDGRPSTLLYKLNNADYLGAADEFDRWNKAAGRVVPGLIRRRDEEQALFWAGIDATLKWYADYQKLHWTEVA